MSPQTYLTALVEFLEVTHRETGRLERLHHLIEHFLWWRQLHVARQSLDLDVIRVTTSVVLHAITDVHQCELIVGEQNLHATCRHNK